MKTVGVNFPSAFFILCKCLNCSLTDSITVRLPRLNGKLLYASEAYKYLYRQLHFHSFSLSSCSSLPPWPSFPPRGSQLSGSYYSASYLNTVLLSSVQMCPYENTAWTCLCQEIIADVSRSREYWHRILPRASRGRCDDRCTQEGEWFDVAAEQEAFERCNKRQNIFFFPRQNPPQELFCLVFLIIRGSSRWQPEALIIIPRSRLWNNLRPGARWR